MSNDLTSNTGCCGGRELTPLEEKDQAIEQLREVVIKQNAQLVTLCSDAPFSGTVLKLGKGIDPKVFCLKDRVWITDAKHEKFDAVGEIISVPDKNGVIKVIFTDEPQKTFNFRIGLKDNEIPQVKILLKDDGTNLTVLADGKEYDVWYPYHLLNEKDVIVRGDTVKVNPKSHQVFHIEKPLKYGPHFAITRIIDADHLEVSEGGVNRTVFHIFDKDTIEVGDDVILDHQGAIAIHHISSKENREFKLRANAKLDVSWDSIGGVAEAKQELIEAIEYPYTHSDYFKYYGCQVPKGILLWGPPGCGKTMLGKAVSNSMAKIFGKDAVESGFNYVKGPEILNMWVGQQEASTRKLFERARHHHGKNGYPCVVFIDEADAILGARRSGETTPEWHNSLVAMWLAEMDGHDTHNGIFIFATNRPGSLDAALVREGRIDKHIKIPRPNVTATSEIFKLYTKNVPLHGIEVNELSAFLTAHIFNENKPMFEVHYKADGSKFTQKEIFHFSHSISGAMIKGIVDTARSTAMRRDMKNKKMIGVTPEDFVESIEKTYHHHRSLNHDFDVMDFMEGKEGFDSHNYRYVPVVLDK